MAEHVFFPSERVEETCPNIILEAGLHSNARSCSSQEHVHDYLLESEKLKSDIVSHPLYEQLLEAHVSCISVGLPTDHIQAVRAQLANKHSVAMKYMMLGRNGAPQPECSNEMDKFMESYLLLLHSMKKHLEDHLVASTAKAMVEYSELQQAFQQLTGMSSTETMGTSIHDSQFQDVEFAWSMEEFDNTFDSVEAYAKMHIEGERSLFDHVREELKMELKEEYLKILSDTREEILRKRKAGTLLGDTTILKQWWNTHSNWPYPTEEEKRQMVKTTGLELRQINNWFINHRKRNWAGRNVPMAPSANKPSSSDDWV